MDELAVGRLGAPYGFKGHLRVQSYSGETAHLLSLREVSLRNAQRRFAATIEDVVRSADGLAFRFSGCDSPETARPLVGCEIWVPRGLAAPLAKDEYYFADLVGCVLELDGKPFAPVLGMSEGGGSFLLEVRKPDGSSGFVPFRNEFIGKVDVKARRIEFLAPWVLE